MEGVKYSDRACCEIGSNTPSEMCSIPDEMIDTNTMGIGGIVGVTIAALFICCCGWASYKKCYKPRRNTNALKATTLAPAPTVPIPAPPAPAASIPTSNTLPVASVVSSYAIPTNNAQVTYGHKNPLLSSKSIDTGSFERGANANAIAMTSPSASAPPMNPVYHDNNDPMGNY